MTEIRRANNFKNLTGLVFYRVTVLGIANEKSKHGNMRYRCVCKCGTQFTTNGSSLSRGLTKSCGCLVLDRSSEVHFRHGKSRTSIHNIWSSMIARCKYASQQNYKYYGGRGISVCDRWLVFENFLEDMGDRPSSDHSIDRINSDGNYEPTNCRWATRTMQSTNKTNTRMATKDGVTKPCAEWDREYGLYPGTVGRRISFGWSEEKAIVTPSRKKQKKQHRT